MRSLEDGKKQKVQSKESKMAAKSNDINSLLIRAIEYCENAKDILDPSRYLFEAAIIFDEIKSYDRSIKCFQSVHLIPGEHIVDAYDLPANPLYERKVERMSKFHLQEFLNHRNALRLTLIDRENERQRLRLIISSCQLVRLYLKQGDTEQAHRSICKAFQHCISPIEHSEILEFAHTSLKMYSVRIT